MKQNYIEAETAIDFSGGGNSKEIQGRKFTYINEAFCPVNFVWIWGEEGLRKEENENSPYMNQYLLPFVWNTIYNNQVYLTLHPRVLKTITSRKLRRLVFSLLGRRN